MAQRGRKSAAELEVIHGGRLEAQERPAPPTDLTDEQKDEWRAVVDRLPADWFPQETWPLLAQYCRHITASRRLSQLIERAEASKDFDVEEYDRLLKMQERESRILTSLATKTRISQQATYDKSKKKSVQVSPPWEDE